MCMRHRKRKQAERESSSFHLSMGPDGKKTDFIEVFDFLQLFFRKSPIIDRRETTQRTNCVFKSESEIFFFFFLQFHLLFIRSFSFRHCHCLVFFVTPSFFLSLSFWREVLFNFFFFPDNDKRLNHYQSEWAERHIQLTWLYFSMFEAKHKSWKVN